MQKLSQRSIKNRKLLDVKDVAEWLGISERTIYNRVRPNATDPFPIKPKRVGKLLRFDPVDVQRYIDGL